MHPSARSHPLATAIPDPRDRTVNDPAVLVDSKYVRAFYDIYGEHPAAGRASQEAITRCYQQLAEDRGWKVTRIGNSMLLQVEVSIDIVQVPDGA